MLIWQTNAFHSFDFPISQQTTNCKNFEKVCACKIEKYEAWQHAVQCKIQKLY